MTLVPERKPADHVAELDGDVLKLLSVDAMHTNVPLAEQGLVMLFWATIRVWSAPAPRKVTPFATEDVSPHVMASILYVPALSFTTLPVPQAVIALLIWLAVTDCTNVGAWPDVPRVEHMLVRVGMPPITPAPDQSVARRGDMMPVEGTVRVGVSGKTAL